MRFHLEDLETGDIQHTDELLSFLFAQLAVDLVDHPQEESVVQSLGQGVT